MKRGRKGIAVKSAQNAELRMLTVVNTGTTALQEVGISGAYPTTGPGTFYMTDVTVNMATGGGAGAEFLAFTGGGVLDGCTLSSPTSLGGFGIWENYAPNNIVQVYNSKISGGTYAIQLTNGGSIQLANCELIGSAPTGPYTCVDCYNGSFAPLNSTCH